MNLTVIVLGVTVLLVIAIIIGVADRHSQNQAWRRIARERRRNWEERQALSDGPS